MFFNFNKFLLFNLNNDFKTLNSNSYKLYYGIRQKRFIINIVYFMFHLKRTLLFIESLIFNKGYLFFYNPNFFINKVYFKFFYMFNDFINGMFTNFKQIKLKIKTLKIPKSLILYNLNYLKYIINESIIFKIPVIGLITPNVNISKLNLNYIIPFSLLNKINIQFIYDIFLRISFLGYKQRLIKLFNSCINFRNINFNSDLIRNNYLKHKFMIKNNLKHKKNFFKFKYNTKLYLNIKKKVSLNYNIIKKKNNKFLKILKRKYFLRRKYYYKRRNFNKRFINIKNLSYKSKLKKIKKKKRKYLYRNRRKKRLRSYLNYYTYSNLNNYKNKKINKIFSLKNLNFFQTLNNSKQYVIGIKSKKKK